MIGFVFPTPVGMSPIRASCRLRRGCVPHARGDEPGDASPVKLLQAGLAEVNRAADDIARFDEYEELYSQAGAPECAL